MKRILIGSVVIFGLAILLSDRGFSAEEKKGHTIKEIMKIAHNDKEGLLTVIGAGVKGEKWDDVTKKSKELVEISGELATAKPPKGETDSWKKLTEEYAGAAKKLEEAAEKKNADDAKTALGSLSASCKTCHAEHKPAKPKK